MKVSATEASPQPVVVAADGTVKLALSEPMLSVRSDGSRSLTVTLVVATVSIAANVCLLTIIGVLSLAPIAWKTNVNNSVSLTIPEELCSSSSSVRFLTLSVRSKSCSFTCTKMGADCLQTDLNQYTPQFILSIFRKMNVDCVEIESKRWSGGQPWADFRKYPYEGRAQCSGIDSTIQSDCDAATSASANRLCMCSTAHQDHEATCPEAFPFEINDTCYRIEKSVARMHGALAAKRCVDKYSGELPILHNITIYEDFIDKLRNCVELSSGRFFLGLQAQGNIVHWDYSSKLNFVPEWGSNQPRMDPIHRRIYVETDNRWYDLPEFETLDEHADLVCQGMPFLVLPGAESRATFHGVRGRLASSWNESTAFAASEPVDCASLCRASPTCLSFSFDYRLTTRKPCFLHSFSSIYADGFVEIEEGVFYERNDVNCVSCTAASPALQQYKLDY